MPHLKIEAVRLWVFWGGLLVFLCLELIIPYREATVSKSKRWMINMGLTAFNALILYLLFASAVSLTARHVSKNQLGVLNLLEIPFWAKHLAITKPSPPLLPRPAITPTFLPLKPLKVRSKIRVAP